MEEQDKLIKDIFLEEIVPECALNTLSIANYKPALSFNTKIKEINKIYGDLNNHNKPVLIIDNINSFLMEFVKYVKNAIYFYFDGLFSYVNIKTVSSLIFANMSINDLMDPISFFKCQTNFIKWSPVNDFSLNFLGYEANIIIKKNVPLLESPYSFGIQIRDKENVFYLPSILFGISDNEAFVYAIQNKDKSNSTLKKKINRMLYKINAGYVKNEVESEKLNTLDVTMSFIAIVTIFIKYLKEIGIKNLNVPVFMPIRYNAHMESCKRRIEYYKSILPKEDFLIKYENLMASEEKYKENVTFKLYRTFKRVLNQGNVLKPLFMTEQVKNGLKFEITEGDFYNELICQIYENVCMKK